MVNITRQPRSRCLSIRFGEWPPLTGLTAHRARGGDVENVYTSVTTSCDHTATGAKEDTWGPPPRNPLVLAVSSPQPQDRTGAARHVTSLTEWEEVAHWPSDLLGQVRTTQLGGSLLRFITCLTNHGPDSRTKLLERCCDVLVVEEDRARNSIT